MRRRVRTEPFDSVPNPPTGVRLGGEDLSREVRRRTHDEAAATAFDLETSPISGIRVNPVGVPARRAGGGSGIGWLDWRGHAATVGRVGGKMHRLNGDYRLGRKS